MKTRLTIAGSDSGGGAGIQADLKTFAAHGVYGTSAITALTAQNTLGVSGVHVVPAEFVTAQIEAVVADIGCDAVKTGMLATAAIVEAVAAAVEALDLPNLVVDPVMVAKGGDRLLDEDAVHAIRVGAVAPGAGRDAECAGSRSARRDADSRSSTTCATAARRILRLGPAAVIVKGGHLPGSTSRPICWSTPPAAIELTGPRIEGRAHARHRMHVCRGDRRAAGARRVARRRGARRQGVRDRRDAARHRRRRRAISRSDTSGRTR